MNKRDYPNLTFSSALGPLDLGPALLGGITVMGLAWFFRRKKTSNSDSNRLFRIVVAVLPALFVVSALATLVLTLATYNGDWVDARQGLATAFAALIAAVGVVVSVAVSYQTGEENRLAQQENLRRQLEHQREIEDERAQREQNKQDAEIIKSLNDRLHEILSRRYSENENERSATYFQLATLYQDWETLAVSSEIVGKQKNSQQRNILKILFGVPQKKDGKLVDERTELEVRTLNSVIQDIFPEYKNNLEEERNTKKVSAKNEFDLSYLDLRRLSFSKRDLIRVNLVGAHLEGAKLWGAYLEGADLRFASLAGADLGFVAMHKANLRFADLTAVNLADASLKSSVMMRANLKHACLRHVCLEGANLREAYLEGVVFLGLEEKHGLREPVVRKRVVDRITSCKHLPDREELLKSKDLPKDLIEEIIDEYKRRRAAQENQEPEA